MRIVDTDLAPTETGGWRRARGRWSRWGRSGRATGWSREGSQGERRREDEEVPTRRPRRDRLVARSVHAGDEHDVLGRAGCRGSGLREASSRRRQSGSRSGLRGCRSEPLVRRGSGRARRREPVHAANGPEARRRRSPCHDPAGGDRDGGRPTRGAGGSHLHRLPHFAAADCAAPGEAVRPGRCFSLIPPLTPALGLYYWTCNIGNTAINMRECLRLLHRAVPEPASAAGPGVLPRACPRSPSTADASRRPPAAAQAGPAR